MDKSAYRYRFGGAIPFQDAVESLLLAVVVAECLFGRSQVRLDASFHIDENNHSCVVDASTAVGRSIARIFTGLLAREFGEDAFEVRRMEALAATHKARVAP